MEANWRRSWKMRRRFGSFMRFGIGAGVGSEDGWRGLDVFSKMGPETA